MPKVIPPSPDASSIGKFTELPVSTYTGIPNISIPLYTVTVRDISVPISLSYHASGIRVEEEASWVGLGWALSAGGSVSRTVRGNDDLVDTTPGDGTGYVYSQAIPEEQPIPGSNPPATTLPYSYVQSLCMGGVDAQPDIFNFSFLGHSAKFYLKRKANFSDSIKVMFASESDNYHVTYDESQEIWTIITPEGLKAIFGSREYSRTMSGPLCTSLQGGQTCDPLYPPDPLSWEPSEDMITAWYLDVLISPTGERIEFEYDIPTGQDRSNYASRSMVSINEAHSVMAAYLSCEEVIEMYGKMVGIMCEGPQDPGMASGNPCENKPRSYSGSMTATWNVYLKKISFNNGEVRFLTDTRDDIQAHFTSNETFAGPRRLHRIEVYQQNEFLKAFDLVQSYYNGHVQQDQYGYKRLKLDEVIESSGAIAKKPYIFAYRGDNELTSTFLPHKKDAARDHWGFYNGKTNNNTAVLGRPALIPKLTYVGSDGMMRTIPGADREADEASAMSGILEKISYPTGGTSQIFYESNVVSAVEAEGAQGEKEYFLSTSAASGHLRVFELNQPAEIVVNADLKCPTLSCYPNGAGTTPCEFTNAMYVEGENYIEITNLASGAKVYSEGYSDYECKYFSTTPCSAGVNVTRCGIHRSDVVTLSAGRYMLKTIPKFGLEVESNLYFKVKLNPFLHEDLVHYTVGGLRVKKIVEHDGITAEDDIVRKFDYTTKDAAGNVLSTGKLMSFPKYHYYQYNTVVSGENISYCTVISSSSSSNVPLGTSAQGSAIGYDKVTIIYGEFGENGYSVFEYKNEADIETQPFLPNSPSIAHTASNGFLLKECHFSRDGFKLREVTNNYVNVSSSSMNALYTFTTNGCGSSANGVTAYKRYSENSEWWQLTNRTEKIFDATDEQNEQSNDVVTTYTYGTTHKMLASETSVSSEGKAIVTYYYYPSDFQDPALAVMWDKTDPNYRHFPGVRIKTETYSGITSPILVSGTRYNYDVIGVDNQVLLQSIEVAGTDGVYEPRIVYDEYDVNGNVLTVRRSDDIPISYMWGYNGVLPVAEVTDALANQIYYEGFEYSPSAVVDRTSSHSGHRFHTGSFSIPFVLPDAGTYELSYWQYVGGSWSLVTQPYTGPTTLMADRLDDIRIHPKGSQMTTYDYDPLTGLITSTDLNNQSTYYEFDKLQRLIWIKDLDKEPMLGYKYVYKN